MGLKAVIRACKEMVEADAREEYEDAEIVGAGRQFWLGQRRISPGTVNRMLQLCLLRSEGIGTKFERHTLNEDGRGFAEDPDNYVPSIMRPNAGNQRSRSGPLD
jgi:hypothetical protein